MFTNKMWYRIDKFAKKWVQQNLQLWSDMAAAATVFATLVGVQGDACRTRVGYDCDELLTIIEEPVWRAKRATY